MDTNMNNIELQNAIVTKSYYSREELAAFIENQKTKNLVESGIYNSKESKVDVQYRNSLQVRVNNENPFINKLRQLITTLNETRFKVSISEYCTENDFVEYNVDGKFEQHKDVLWPVSVFDHDKNPVRKLTTVVLLNDDFTGGKLALWSKGERYSFTFEPGDVVTFPSYIHHKVDPVLSGTRYTAVSWSYGEF